MTGGHRANPGLFVKCAYCLADLSGPSMVAGGIHFHLEKPPIPDGEADPVHAVEPRLSDFRELNISRRSGPSRTRYT